MKRNLRLLSAALVIALAPVAQAQTAGEVDTQVSSLARGAESKGKHCGRGALFSVAARDVLQHPEVVDEVFGPSSMVIRCADEAQLLQSLEQLERR